MDVRNGFSRRGFLKTSAGAFSALALSQMPSVAGAAPVAAAGAPVKLVAGPQLFLDDYLIASQHDVRRVINVPQRLPEPIVTAAEDKNFQPYVSVLRDPETGRFRMWYNVPVSAGQSHIAYMESDDGIKWIRPHRVLEDPSRITFGVSVLDDEPGGSDPSRRYKLATWQNGLWIAFSADGLKWTSASSERVLKDIGDIVFLSRDPIRQRYLLTCKVNARPEDRYKGRTQNADEGTRRLVGQSVSDDCRMWTPMKRIILADDKDEGVTEFYSIGGVVARGGLLIGLLKVLRDDLPHEPDAEVHGIGYTCLAWTRDGENWERDREPFLPRNPKPGTWDRAMTWGDYQLPVGGEMYLYYGGYARGHKVERFKERQLGLARMKLDRYVSRDAGASGGTLRTRLMTFGGKRLSVNLAAGAGGSATVAILDPAGRPVGGFSHDDCEKITGDDLRRAVTWKQGKSDVSTLSGKLVQLDFRLKSSKLYAFEIAEDA